ncbi:MAG: hypothetical protein WC476_12500 [Phycisphaerae bacterium]|jgi:hypothetical protein
MKNEEMTENTLYCDLSRNIKFKGRMIAHNRWETGTGTHTRMELYKTSGENWACHKVYETQWQGSDDKYLAKICRTHAEVIAFFGLGDQAKSLYSQAGIDHSISEDEYLAQGNPKQGEQDLNEFDQY